MAKADKKLTGAGGRIGETVFGAVFVLFLTLGLGSLFYGIAVGKVRVDPGPITLARFMDGEVMQHFAGGLSQAGFPVAMADLERGGSWLLTGGLGPRVRQGCEGWLYLADELAVHADAVSNANARVQTIVRVTQKLAERGIKLVVALVPDKSRIQHQQMCALYRPPAFADRLQAWTDALAASGVNVLSLDAALVAQEKERGDPVFLRTDTHWNESGASAAALALAQAIKASGAEIQPVQTYKQVVGKAERRPGDLVRLAGIDWLPVVLQPAPESVSTTAFVPVSTIDSHDTGQPAQAQPEQAAATPDADTGADLFGDEGLPTLALVGTSYSRTSQFLPLLENSLQTKIPSFARDGGDFWGSAQYYFSSPSFRETPPKLVIWEIPERVMQMPLAQKELEWRVDPIPEP